MYAGCDTGVVAGTVTTALGVVVAVDVVGDSATVLGLVGGGSGVVGGEVDDGAVCWTAVEEGPDWASCAAPARRGRFESTPNKKPVAAKSSSAQPRVLIHRLADART
jgi:hypothetical protein